MKAIKTALFLSLVGSLGACGGGGGGDSSSAPPAPVARNLAPEVSTDDLIIGSGTSLVTLTATASDPEGDPLTYSWTQTRGAPVSGQQGFDAATMSFMHSRSGLSEVETLGFTVQVSDGTVSTSASVDVLMTRDATRAAFVDGDRGSDSTGDGSLTAPYASIKFAADNSAATDLYIRTLPFDAAYEESENSITLTDGRSIYGGFDENWVRDIVDNKTIVEVNSSGLRFLPGASPVEVSGLDVTARSPRGYTGNSPDDTPIKVNALFVSGDDYLLRLAHNVFESETAVPTIGFNNGGSSIAVSIIGARNVVAVDNMVIAGDGNASPAYPNPGGFSSVRASDGGAGGAGGNEANENGGNGRAGGRNISGSCGNGGAGGSGAGAEGGDGSDGQTGCAYGVGSNGIGGTGFGAIRVRRGIRSYAISRGGLGEAGANGGGGGGGGGGEAANGLGLDGGVGGTGGRGGRGGAAVPGSYSGGASIGIEILNTGTFDLQGNYIRTGNGGPGGAGASTNAGEAGRSGASGGKGKTGVLNDGGDGGNGGTGGRGATSGVAGAGGGGPSFAVMLSQLDSARIDNNTFETGSGGAGGEPFIPPREPAGVRVTHGKGGFSVGVFHWEPGQVFTSFDNNSFMLGEAGAGGRPSSQIGTGVSAERANPETALPFN